MIKNLTKKEIILSIISIPILTFFWYFLFTLFGYASVILSVVLSLYSIYEVLRTRALIKEIRKRKAMSINSEKNQQNINDFK